MDMMSAVEDYLLGLDLEQMCEEMGITQEDILRRFRDRTHKVYERIDRGYEWNLLRSVDEDDSEYESNYKRAKRIIEDDDDE